MKYFVYMTYIPSLVDIFVSTMYLAITCEIDVAGFFGIYLVYICPCCRLGTLICNVAFIFVQGYVKHVYNSSCFMVGAIYFIFGLYMCSSAMCTHQIYGLYTVWLAYLFLVDIWQ